MPTTTNPPAVSGSKAVAGLKGKQKRFITILKDDFQFDIIERIVKHIRQLEKAKRIKPLEKARLLQNYYLTLLNFCIPKMKLEDTNKSVGQQVRFNITVAHPQQQASGLNVTIPTVNNGNGNFSIDPTLPMLPVTTVDMDPPDDDDEDDPDDDD